MKWYKEDHFFCIVDEVDSILIDEARTPLLFLVEQLKINLTSISNVVINLLKNLEKSDYELDEKNKNVMLSENGYRQNRKTYQFKRMEFLKNNNFYDPQNINLVHHINQALKSKFIIF